MQQPPALVISQVLAEPQLAQVLAPMAVTIRGRFGVYVPGQCDADHAATKSEEQIHWDGVVVQGPVGECVKGRLDKLTNARHADQGAVDAAECCVAEDL